MVEVRRARADEIAACAALYERVLRETFTWDPPGRHSAADFLAHALDEEVYLARNGDRLLGIAGFHRPSAFLHSLYVETRGAGVGKALLTALIATCEGLGLRQMCAVIGDSGNAASIGLHAALGFEKKGIFPDMGHKFGRWVDLVWMQRPLNGGGSTPPDAPGMSLSGV